MSAANPLPVVAEPVRTALRLLIVGSPLLAVLYILRPFLPSMLWSAFVVIAVWPGLTWLKNRLHWSRTACALLLAAALIGFVIGPLLAGILAIAEHGETLVLDYQGGDREHSRRISSLSGGSAGYWPVAGASVPGGG